MDLSVALAASNTWRTWGCGTASSALCSMARNGTVRDFAQVTPSALLSSGDHWDNQARSVEKRAMPTGPLFTVSGMPMKHRPIGRSLGSMVGSRKRGSAMVRGVTNPRSTSWSPFRLRVSRVSITHALRRRSRARWPARNAARKSALYGGRHVVAYKFSAGSMRSGSFSSNTEGSIHSESIRALPVCAAWKMKASAGIRPAFLVLQGAPAGGGGIFGFFTFDWDRQYREPPPGPANKHHLLVLPDFLCMAYVRAKVDYDVFHDQRAVVALISTAGAQHMRPMASKFAGHGQQLQGRRGMHEPKQCLRWATHRGVTNPLQVHRTLCPYKAVNLLEDAGLSVVQVNPFSLDLVDRCDCALHGDISFSARPSFGPSPAAATSPMSTRHTLGGPRGGNAPSRPSLRCRWSAPSERR